MAEDKVVEEGRVWAIIAYLWILFLVTLIGKKSNKFAVYHAKQGLMLFIVWAVVFIIGFIPIIGWIVSILGGIFMLVLFIVGIVNAATGKYKPLPVVGQYAEKWKI